jgi:hypothetical protein
MSASTSTGSPTLRRVVSNRSTSQENASSDPDEKMAPRVVRVSSFLFLSLRVCSPACRFQRSILCLSLLLRVLVESLSNPLSSQPIPRHHRLCPHCSRISSSTSQCSLLQFADWSVRTPLVLSRSLLPPSLRPSLETKPQRSVASPHSNHRGHL